MDGYCERAANAEWSPGLAMSWMDRTPTKSSRAENPQPLDAAPANAQLTSIECAMIRASPP